MLGGIFWSTLLTFLTHMRINPWKKIIYWRKHVPQSLKRMNQQALRIAIVDRIEGGKGEIYVPTDGRISTGGTQPPPPTPRCEQIENGRDDVMVRELKVRPQALTARYFAVFSASSAWAYRKSSSARTLLSRR